MFEDVRTAVARLETAAPKLDPGCFEGRGAADLLEVFARGERVCAAAKSLLRERPVPGDRPRGVRRRPGRTDIANLWRLCSHHHRLKTYGGWIVVGENGDRDLVPPDDPDPP